MAWTGITSFETTDGSTTPTDGNNISGTGSGEGTGWSGGWVNRSGTGRYDYDNGQAQDGSWSAHWDSAGSNLEEQCGRVLSSASTSGRISFRWRQNRDDRDNPGLYVYNGSTRALYILFGQDTTGTGRDLDSNAGEIASDVFSNDTWYHVEIDYDCAGSGTYSVYVDGSLQGAGGHAFENTASSINEIRMANNTASGFSATPGNLHWFDNFADGDAASSSIKSIAGVAQASIKSIAGVANASIKSVAGVANS